MSLVDYGQTVEDHQALLVLVRQSGTALAPKMFARAWERVARLTCIHVPGQKRTVWVRYKRAYPRENNEWGDFQAHRKVLGLVAVGQCSNHDEFGQLFDNYKKIKEEYEGTIYNSRLVVFGMNTDGSPLDSAARESGLDKSSTENSQRRVNSVAAGDEGRGGERFVERRKHSNSLTKESSGSEVVFYPDLDTAQDLEERLREFVTSLFFVLEGKRLDRSFERADKQQLLCAPFEKKDYVGVDTDTKSFKKKCMGRLRKHLGDLCLQAGLPGEAILHYQTALDMLRGVNDFLWMGACFEGLSSASAIMTYPRSQSAPLKRNLSFSVKRGPHHTLDTRANTYANGLDLAEVTQGGGLNPDDIIEKYQEAIANYSKYKNAAMIEMEACLKACRVLILQRKYLQASDFLQNVMYINLQISEEDKKLTDQITRFTTLAGLYQDIGFHRKAAFFRRVAAMQCVSPGSGMSWQHCYNLVLQAIPGYSLSLNPRDFSPDRPQGWPVIQYRVLHELVYSSRRMGNPQLAVRHMTFLLHAMFEHLGAQERREAVSGLESLTASCEGTPQPLPLENGTILPPVPLTKFPTLKSFKLVRPVPHLHPMKQSPHGDSSPAPASVFIFSPLSVERKKSTVKNNVDFRWVAEEMCEVQMQVVNPLSEELHVSHMSLLTEGVEMELFPAQPSVPAESGPYQVKLYGKPRGPGTLKILGYTTRVFGVRSHCRLRDLPVVGVDHFAVEVVPALPQMTLTSSLPKAASFASVGDSASVVASATAQVYAGQSLEVTVTLHNCGSQPVQRLDVSLDCRADVRELLGRVFTWSDANIQSQLPLAPGAQLCFSLTIHGYCDFLPPDLQAPLNAASPVYSSRSRSDSQDNRCAEALLVVNYSGGPGLQSSFCRQCSLSISTDILPSLLIPGWDVQPADSPDHCCVSLDLQNSSSHQVDVEYRPGATIVIEPQQTRRVVLEVPRLEFGEEVEDRTDTSPTPAWTALPPVHPHSQLLASMTDVRWTMTAVKATGRVNLDHLRWSKEQKAIIASSPVHWEVRINKQLYLAPDECRFETDEIVEVDVTLSSKGVMSEAGVLAVTAIQDERNSMESVCPASTVTSIGTCHASVPKSPAWDKVHHRCSFLFHCPGRFQLDVSFTSRAQDGVASERWQCRPWPLILIE